MPLIDVVKKMLLRLWQEDNHWETLFAAQGFAFSQAELLAMDTKTLTTNLLDESLTIDRNQLGFEDFARAGKRMIEPGNPACSLLYHALASPNIYYLNDAGDHLTAFPTLFEIDALENFIYSLKPLDINAILQDEGPDNVAIGIFCYEYRQTLNTTHRKHADFCFSRTGVARVGTEPHRYEPNLRSFTIFPDSTDQKGMRVFPARYGAFVAVRRHIKDSELSVMPYIGQDADESDVVKNRGFWVPVHKLFSGEGCLKNHANLSVSYSMHHENIKLKKVCEYLKQTKNRNLDAKPYTITEGLVEMLFFSDDGNNRTACMWVSPVPHPLVEEGLTENGERVTIKVPPDPENEYFAALTLREVQGARPAPEYVNVRRRLESNGQVTDLNTKPDVAKIVAKGNYNALMHIDHSCDGWIVAVVPGIPLNSLPAYSLVTAPDFIPYAEQRELIEWGESQKNRNYWVLEPWALSDSRLLPNVTLKNSPFSMDKTDNTIQTCTALVGPLQLSAVPKNANPCKLFTKRSSCLPSAAAGEFQPGWDITWDRTADNNPHLSAYGLGSPFLEDAKLCAALSTFWPAAAPDIARSYVMEGWPSVCPLTDEEIGQDGSAAWDGVPGPKRLKQGNKDWAQLPDFNHVDYVSQGLLGQFSISKIGTIDTDEYQNRVDAMWHVYNILKALTSKPNWRVFSFRKISKTDSTLIADIGQVAAQKMQDGLFAVTIYRKGEQRPGENNQTVLEEMTRENKFYIDNSQPRQVWRKKTTGAWLEVDIEETIPG